MVHKEVKLEGVDQEIPYYKRHKKYLAEVKKIQKSHLSKDQWNTKEKINEDWEKTWLPFIKYDHQYDWAYMLDILIYKLELMRTSFKYFCSSTDQEKMIKQLDDAISLGRRIYNHENKEREDYEKPFSDYHKKHSTPYAYVYDKLETESQCESHKRKKLLATIEMPKDDSMNFKHMLNKKYVSPLDKWLKQNHKIEYKNVTVSFGSEWNNFPKIRHLISKHILKKCRKNYKKDKEKFFKIISDNMESWWD